jgi:negative regulator of sigma E activity
VSGDEVRSAGKADVLIDDAIDTAVRDIMGAEPPAGLRHRVLRRLSEPERRRLFTVPRLAVVAAVALAVVIGTVLVRRDQTTASIRVASAPVPVRQIEPTAPTKGGRDSEPVAIADRHPRTSDTPARTRGRREPDARMVSATSVADADTVVIAPLDAIDKIQTAPVGAEVVRIDQITVAPLQMEAVRVDPLSSTPR